MGVIADKYGDLSNPPLVYTLFMLRFPIQTALDDAIPAIQAKLKAKYPIYDPRTQQSIEIIQSKEGQSFRTTSTLEYLFFDSERKKGFLIKNDRIVFHTTVYPSFEDFSSCFMSVVSAVTEALTLSHFVSVGLRYIDTIVPDDNESLGDLLSSSLMSFDIEDVGISKTIASNQINHYKTSEGVLVLKANILFENDLSIPPELRDLASFLIFNEQEKRYPFAVLDFDHGFTPPDDTVTKLDLDALNKKVSTMHDITSRAFLKAINENKVGKWK